MVGHVDIGIRYYGKTAAIGKEAVYTAYFVVGIPLVPTGCHYGIRYGNRCEDLRGRRIRWHFRSILLGYIRWTAVVPSVALVAYASPNANRPEWSLSLLLLAILFAAIYAALFLLFVKASPREAKQRTLMAQIVRTTADPAWLPREECQTTISNLRPVLDSLHVSLDPRAWQLRTPDPELAPFLYTYARYMHALEPENDWDDAADRVWTHLELAATTAANTPLSRL